MRIVCWFSCGAASAIATKLAIAENADKLPLIIAYTEVIEEHPDNKRFLADCENGLVKRYKFLEMIFTMGQFTKYLKRTIYAPLKALLAPGHSKNKSDSVLSNKTTVKCLDIPQKKKTA